MVPVVLMASVISMTYSHNSVIYLVDSAAEAEEAAEVYLMNSLAAGLAVQVVSKIIPEAI
ncbi:MAG: hypothetical protein R3A12_17375 [Ignavibacteria bacterium]